MVKNIYNMELTIGITTFSKRFDYLTKLITQIRKFNKKDKILICVNGEKNGDFDENFRKNILNLCSFFEHVYPIFFIEIRGLSKMWNTLIITSNTDNVLLLNDDIEILNKDFFDIIKNNSRQKDFSGILRINNSFSHFLVNKKIINSLGYFDERLLGFGEEDGDIIYRMQKEGITLNNIYIENIINLISTTRHDEIKKGIGKYSNYNRSYIYEQKYEKDLTSEIKGIFDTPMKEKLTNLNCYPMEDFFDRNKENLYEN